MTTRQFVRAHPWLPWILAAVCLVLAAGFAVLGAGVLHGAMENVDRTVRDWIVAHRPAWSVGLADVVSMVGSTEWIVVIGVIVGWALLRRGWSWIFLLVACATVSSHLVDGLKDFFEVVRPPTGVIERDSLSFPSGHSAGSAAVCLFLAYVISRQRRAIEIPATVVGIAVAAAVGLSRMFLDMHWLSDVIGGWVVGITVAVAFCAIWEWTQRYQRANAVTANPPPGVGTTRS